MYGLYPEVILIQVLAHIQKFSLVKRTAVRQIQVRLIQLRLLQIILPITRLSQQQDHQHGLLLLHAKVLLHIGLWVAVVEAVVPMIMQALEAEVEV
jgi:hypothetical protein